MRVSWHAAYSLTPRPSGKRRAALVGALLIGCSFGVVAADANLAERDARNKRLTAERVEAPNRLSPELSAKYNHIVTFGQSSPRAPKAGQR